MLAGHVAVALAAKRTAPEVSLGALTLAALLPDLLGAIFLLSGLEHIEIHQGVGAANYLTLTSIGFSHSLVMDALWASLFAAAYFTARRRPRGAWIVFAAVLSHWVLDWLSHRPDMPLVPGGRGFGAGLWTSVGATLLVEGGMWLAAIALYVTSTRAKQRIGVYAFWIGALLLTTAWYNNIAGSPPPHPRAAPVASLVFFSLVIVWAYWLDAKRLASAQPVSAS